MTNANELTTDEKLEILADNCGSGRIQICRPGTQSYDAGWQITIEPNFGEDPYIGRTVSEVVNEAYLAEVVNGYR